MSTVVELKTRSDEVNQSVVETLESALEAAKQGKLVAVAIAGVMPDGSAFTSGSASDCMPGLLGALSIMEHRMLFDRTPESI